jgi:hypothetical protein
MTNCTGQGGAAACIAIAVPATSPPKIISERVANRGTNFPTVRD